ncbi:four-carbon acid sugar kinase family protein [Puniceibacterium confluentis]|uniref:four-carbon acid sugar kinase family protein n=1 Tax=Puniceibacterium confluentis TaxID=1958944 RepID=UPI0011B639AF|nr:four-carbon acid sugar kinase family protein [Puniceibacterium confluentis]
MTRLLLIADDLTGALDSAAAFAVRGLRVRVATEPRHLGAALDDPSLQIIAVATSTRELTPGAAAGIIRDMAAEIAAFDGIVFKKVDSRLKGNIASELAELARLRPGPVLACPAIPRLGRFVDNAAVTGAGVARPIPVAPLLCLEAAIVDARRDADIDAALPDDLSGPLYVGAAGLAEALARRFAAQPAAPCDTEPKLPLLMAIGSRDPITLAQIAALSLPVTAAPDGCVPPMNRQAVQIVQLTAGPGPAPGVEVGAQFADQLVRELRAAMPATLFACGGETAAALLRGLDIRHLDLLDEILPGVPVARCPASGLNVITKSGGFGEATLLKQLVNMFAKAG